LGNQVDDKEALKKEGQIAKNFRQRLGKVRKKGEKTHTQRLPGLFNDGPLTTKWK